MPKITKNKNSTERRREVVDRRLTELQIDEKKKKRNAIGEIVW